MGSALAGLNNCLDISVNIQNVPFVCSDKPMQIQSGTIHVKACCVPESLITQLTLSLILSPTGSGINYR